MDITGQYFCSFSIKGQPYDEEFKIVLEALVSVYDKTGALQTNVVSKLASKPIIIKSLMKSSLKEGLELSEAVFEKQVDDYQTEPQWDPLIEENATVRQRLEAIKQYEVKAGRHKPVQKLRLDCFWIHLAENDTENARTTSPVKIMQANTNRGESQRSSISNSGNLLINDQFQGIAFQPFVLNAAHNTSKYLNKVRLAENRSVQDVVKTELQVKDENTVNIKNIVKTSIADVDEENNVCPVGLPYIIKKEPLESAMSREGNLADITDTSYGTDSVAADAFTGDADKDVFNTISDTMASANIIQTNDYVKPAYENGQINCEMNAFEIKNEMSQTDLDHDNTLLRPLHLDHAYEMAKSKPKVKRPFGKVGRPRKNVRKALNNGRKDIAPTRNSSIKRVIKQKGSVNMVDQLQSESSLSEETERPSKDHGENKTSNTFDDNLNAIKSENKESDTESVDNSGKRKRRRCSRNVNYKALAQSIETDESEKEDLASPNGSDSGSSYDPVEEINFNEFTDPDYKLPKDSGASENEESTDEGESTMLGIDVEDEARILEQIEKKKTKTKKKKQSKNVEVKMNVSLSEHEDKFEMVKFVSSEQKNRGKPVDEISHDSYACKICNSFQTIDKDSMSLHIGQHIQGNLRCKICKIECPSYGRKLDHLKQEHPGEFADKGTVCEQCGCPFANKIARRRHMYKVHKIPSFECRLCIKQGNSDAEKFASPDEVYKHEKERHSKEIYVCSKCDNHYQQKQHYTMHVAKCNIMEFNERPKFQCNECSYSAKRRERLMHHVQRVHRKEKNCKCELCDFTSYAMCSIRRHMAHAHLGENSIIIEPQHDNTNKMTCAPSEDSDQPGHPPNLIRVILSA